MKIKNLELYIIDIYFKERQYENKKELKTQNVKFIRRYS